MGAGNRTLTFSLFLYEDNISKGRPMVTFLNYEMGFFSRFSCIEVKLTNTTIFKVYNGIYVYTSTLRNDCHNQIN